MVPILPPLTTVGQSFLPRLLPIIRLACQDPTIMFWCEVPQNSCLFDRKVMVTHVLPLWPPGSLFGGFLLLLPASFCSRFCKFLVIAMSIGHHLFAVWCLWNCVAACDAPQLQLDAHQVPDQVNFEVVSSLNL